MVQSDRSTRDPWAGLHKDEEGVAIVIAPCAHAPPARQASAPTAAADDRLHWLRIERGLGLAPRASRECMSPRMVSLPSVDRTVAIAAKATRSSMVV
jgi:hypothetical protein